MKRVKDLYKQLISASNLDRAINRSAAGKTKRPYVQEVLQNSIFHIGELKKVIENNTFTQKIHRGVVIYDGHSRKKRLIIKPIYMYEQIVQHAVMNILQPIFMKSMYAYSCGSVPKRGIHYGKRHIEKFIKDNKHKPQELKYCLKLDIKHFYQNVDTERLKKKFRRIIKDKDMLIVLDTIVDSNVAKYGKKIVKMGLPIGFYTSQWFSNFFLQDFDHYVKEQLKVKCYVRYVDDMILFHSNKKELHKIFLKIKAYLESEGLTVKDNWQIFRFDYINKKGKRIGRALDFMGFKFYRDRTILRRTLLLKCTRKAKKIYKKKLHGKKVTWYDCSQMISYMGWFSHAKCHGTYEKYIKPCVSIPICKAIISKHSKHLRRKALCNM